MNPTKQPTTLVLLAPGAEEMEVVIAVDVLRRGGVDVVLAGVDGADAVPCSRGVRLLPDVALTEALRGGRTYDAVVLPGGAGGAERLANSAAVGELLRDQAASGRWIAAICAAPTALVSHGVAAGRRLTSHPSVRDAVQAHGDYVEDAVVVDGRFVTSRGPGTAFGFALTLVELLCGAARRDEVAAPMVFAP